MLFANCHNHSTFSDGAYPPEKIVELAKEVGHKAIVLTDHDTVKGTYFAQKAARKLGLLSILGCEFSTRGFGTGFHLLGFDFNPDNKDMKALLARTSGKQTERSRILFERGLKRGTLKEGITWQEVLDTYPDNDYFCNNQIFETYFNKGIYKREEYYEFFKYNFKPAANEEREIEETTGLYTPAIEEVVNVIRKAGGVPIIAHPHGKEKYVKDLISIGIMGFETRHPDLKDEGEPELYDRICTENNLYKLGGTDHHGVLGGYTEVMPWHICDPKIGYTSEEEFMKLYERKLG